jgi:hypothetical protein
MKLYQFSFSASGIFIITPLFHFQWSIYDCSPQAYEWWLGFEFLWKRRKNPQEGDLIFEKNFKYKIDSITALEQI